MRGSRSWPARVAVGLRSPHFWAIGFLAVITGAAYYFDYLDLAWLPFGTGFLAVVSEYHLCFVLLLVLMLYPSYVFGLKGALFACVAALFIILPRNVLLSPPPLGVLSTMLWLTSAGAVILLAVAQTERHQQKDTLRELDTALARVQAEARRVEASEARYRDLFESASDGMIIRDLQGRIIEANQAAADLTGYTREELSGLNIGRTVSPHDFSLIIGRQQELLGNRPAARPYELELIRKDGTRRTVESVARRVLTQDGQPAIQATIRDVTERRQAEENLRESEERFSKAFRSSPCAVGLTTLAEGVFLEVNDCFTELTGYSREEAIGHTALEIGLWLAPQDRARVVQTLQEHGEVRDAEISVRTKSGEVRHAEMSAVRIDLRGERCILAGVNDVTERKRMEAALRKSEATYRSLVEGSHVGVGVVDLTGRFTFVNGALCQMAGYPPEEVLGKFFAGFIHPEDRQAITQLFYAAPTPPRESAYMEFRIVTKSGDTVHAGATASAVRQDNGLSGFISIVVDISDRKRAEAALQESAEFSSRLLSNSPYPVAVVNPDTTIRYVNPALEKLTGYTAAEITGRKPPYPWWPEETRARMFGELEKAMASGAARQEYLFEKKTGERFWVEITGTPVVVEGQFRYFLATWVDITERRRFQENLQFYIAEITRAQEEERKRIARELHDETAQSLAVLLLDIDVLLRDARRDQKDDVVRSLEQLRRNANQVMEDLRRFCFELRPGILDLGWIPAMELLTEELTSNGGTVAYVEVLGDDRRLPADAEVLLFRIAQEALRNVRKHSRAGEASVIAEFMPERVRMTVSDNGAGCALPETIDELAGRGKLGIIGMRERALLLGGEFKIESSPGNGTRVTVELPTPGDYQTGVDAATE